MRPATAILPLVLCCSVLHAQWCIREISTTDSVYIDQSESVFLAAFGKPSRTDTLIAEGCRTHFYDKGLIVWTDTETKAIVGIDVSSRNFATVEGAKLGDTKARLLELYGEGRVYDEVRHLHSYYAYTFKDFSQILYYEYVDGSFHAFYLKNDRLVRIHYYKGTQE